LAAAFAVLGIFLLDWLVAEPLIRTVRARDWKPTECTILSSVVRREWDAHGLTRYYADVLYTYRVGDAAYYSNTIRFTESCSFLYRGGKAELVAKYPENSHATCYVNSEHPEQCTLQRDVSPTVFYGILPMTLIVLGVAG